MTNGEGIGMRRFEEFFDTELAPLVRRMADRPLDGDTSENDEVRAMVWQGLTSLGALRLRLPSWYGGEAASQEDLVSVAEQLGRVLCQGPFLDTVTATELLLGVAESSEVRGLLAEIADGASVALAPRADAGASPADPAGMTVHGDDGLVDARRCFVGFAPEVDHLLLVGRTPTGVRVAVTPRDHPTVSVRRHEELGRGELYEVRCQSTPVLAWLGDGQDWAKALVTARIRQAGYLVGMAQGAVDLAVAYAKEREQFGQPIGRFQAVAFRLAELTARIDAARVLTRSAARRADRGADPSLAAAQCLAAAAQLARVSATDAMQVHGAAGMLLDSDIQLYYRRAAVEALWLGGPTQLGAEAAPLLRERVSA
ncbi:MAG: acyl-CoA dehydrogenase family protein [Micromonosporaceae bacterium]